MSRYRGQIILLLDVCLIFAFNFLLFLPALLRGDIRLLNLLLHIGLLTVCVLVFFPSCNTQKSRICYNHVKTFQCSDRKSDNIFFKA